MNYFSTNYRCEVVLWLAVTVFTINCGIVLTQPPHARAHYVRGNNNRDQSSERQDEQFPFNNNPGPHFQETNERQNFPLRNYPGQQYSEHNERHPYGNHPGQQILDRIRTNLEQNSNFQFGHNQGNFNLGDIAQNTYNILNKTFENLNKFSNGNFGNFNQFIPSPQPNFNRGGNEGVVTPPPKPRPKPTPTPKVPIVPATQSTDNNGGQNNNVGQNNNGGKNNNGGQNNFETTTSKSTDDNVSHYIEGFPVIPLKPNEIRKR